MMRFVKRIKLSGYDEEIQVWHTPGKWHFHFRRRNNLSGLFIDVGLGPYIFEYTNLDPY